MKRISLLFMMVLFIGLSSFDSIESESKRTARILVAPNQDVFTTFAQQMMLSTINKAINASSENPCSGSCVCESWQQYGDAFYRRCGCYWGGDFWYEKKDCGYCPGVPSWGSECTNG